MTFWFNKTNIDANFVNWIIDDAGAYKIELQPNRIKGTGEIRCGIYWLIMMEARETTNHIRYTRFIIYYYCIDLFFFSLLLYCIRRVNIAGNNDIDRNNISNGVMTAITGYKWALIHWHLNEFYQHRNCVGRGKKKGENAQCKFNRYFMTLLGGGAYFALKSFDTWNIVEYE